MTKVHLDAGERARRINSYFSSYRERLELLEQMWSDPRVQCYNDAHMPEEAELKDGAVFIAGPTSRHQILEYNYRCEAVGHLREAGFAGYIYVPEPRGKEFADDFTERGYIHKWESDRLFGKATKKVFWIPRMADELLGLNTNLEFGIALGMILAGSRIDLFVGWPEGAERMGLPNHYSSELASQKRYDSLRSLCFAVMGKLSPEDSWLVEEADDDAQPAP